MIPISAVTLACRMSNDTSGNLLAIRHNAGVSTSPLLPNVNHTRF
jgi:hypothetical protein